MSDNALQDDIDMIESIFEDEEAIEIGTRLVWRYTIDGDESLCYVLDQTSSGTWNPRPWVATIKWAAKCFRSNYAEDDEVVTRPLSELPNHVDAEYERND